MPICRYLQFSNFIASAKYSVCVFLACTTGCIVLELANSRVAYSQPPAAAKVSPPNSKPVQNKTKVGKFDAQIAYEHLTKICAIGPRVSTTNGMLKQQKYIGELFEPLKAEISMQRFNVSNPLAGQQGFNQLELANMVVRFRPEKKDRLLFCCHYDTRPYPDRDRRNPQGTFIGANDGGSGVAVLCELGRHLAEVDGHYGIDIVFFDGEEFVYVNRRDPMFLGSTHFANQYVQRREDYRYAYAVLIDMVGDANLQIYFERNSLTYAPRLTRSIWGVAQRLNVKEFVPKQKYTITDDHLPLNNIARIPTCDIIDFDYPTPRSKNAFWHTEKDTLENCSADSLGKVGKVLLQWAVEMQKLNAAPAGR